jgi:hypothetical protein
MFSQEWDSSIAAYAFIIYLCFKIKLTKVFLRYFLPVK